MRHTTISGRRRTQHRMSAWGWIIAAFWIVAGIVAVSGLEGGLTRLTVLLAIVVTEWWLIPEIEDRLETNAAASRGKVAPVTHLRQHGQRDLTQTSAHASWRGPRAA